MQTVGEYFSVLLIAREEAGTNIKIQNMAAITRLGLFTLWQLGYVRLGLVLHTVQEKLSVNDIVPCWAK